MRALVLTGPRQAVVQEVPVPRAGRFDVVVEVHLVGVCGTDQELYSGEMAYLHSGRASYPLRPGHEWSGVVRDVGNDVDAAWLGARVTGDTMLWCGRCDRCLAGRRHICRDLVEVGISMGFAGALAERLVVPAASLHRLPAAVDDIAGAMVEPGGNAWRAAAAVHAAPGTRILVWGTGTIGLLAVAFAVAAGAEVQVVGRRPAGLEMALRMGAVAAWTGDSVPDVPFDGIIDATDDPAIPGEAVRRVEPGGRIVLIGLAGAPSVIDTRELVLRDVTAVGLLSGSPGLAQAIRHFADGLVDPRPLVGATVGLAMAPEVLAGAFQGGDAPKIQIDPRR
ncbi:MAG: alcohol dehydrogenase catalytic domain-containing protein [Candidatus Limnocylindrales bacterium]